MLAGPWKRYERRQNPKFSASEALNLMFNSTQSIPVYHQSEIARQIELARDELALRLRMDDPRLVDFKADIAACETDDDELAALHMWIIVLDVMDGGK